MCKFNISDTESSTCGSSGKKPSSSPGVVRLSDGNYPSLKVVVLFYRNAKKHPAFGGMICEVFPAGGKNSGKMEPFSSEL